MSYFFQVANKNQQGIVLITTEYLCEDTNKNNLLILGLPCFYKIKDFYGKWFNSFTMYVSNNEFLYSAIKDKYSFACNLNTPVTGKYYLIIYVFRS